MQLFIPKVREFIFNAGGDEAQKNIKQYGYCLILMALQ